MITRRLVILAVAVCISCKQQAPPKPGTPAAAVPQVQATVVTILTTVEPAKKTYTHSLIITGDRARHTGELDAWRLYDTGAGTITFVDDVKKTVRVEKLQDVQRRRRAALATALPPHYPRLRLAATATKKPLHGTTATQNLIEANGYRRELWLAEHPAIPAGLFGMMQASERSASPLEPMMRAVDEALMTTRGFPLVDRSEVTYGNEKMVVERSVVSIQKQNVAATAVAVPKGYEDVTPKPPPAKKKEK
ncbi:MAG TPA: hypothetical protein VGF28_20115 [Thermoanaerobaculia bacterium]